MKRNMGLVLIIAGIVLLAIGVFLVSRKDNTKSSHANVRTSGMYRTGDYGMKNNGGKTDASSSPVSETEPSAQGLTSNAVKDVEQLDSKQKGDMFEDFTVNLLADWRMKLLDRTQDKMSSAGVVAESCREPDLHIEQKRGKSAVDYYLECKYRSQWKDDAVTFDDWQIKRYRDFQRTSHRKVIIALGVGGSPSFPESLMLVPIDSLVNNSIKKAWITRYSIQPNSDALAAYIEHYFDEVFATARKRTSTKK